mgnify:CR=1 FL=1|tara:strand:- start:636 stop:1517 length:882 start_codon:yes stop_codon:yes gene_type:complete
MAKQKGARANKPNDNKGTIDDQNLYRNKYREDVYKDDEDVQTKSENTSDPVEEKTETATQQVGESFVETKANHDYKKRYDDLKRHYDDKIAEWKEKEASLSNSWKTVSKDIRIPQSREEYEDLKTENPELYNTLESLSTAKAEEQLQVVKKELDDYKGRATQLQREKAFEELLRLQPSFNKLKSNEKFLDWLKEQPASISDGIYNNSTDAKWASRVIDLYLADTGKSTKKVEKTDDAAASVQAPQVREVRTTDAKGNRIWKASEIQRMKSWEFEKFEKEIDQARSEGRIDFSS